jgi:hypothetical protein
MGKTKINSTFVQSKNSNMSKQLIFNLSDAEYDLYQQTKGDYGNCEERFKQVQAYNELIENIQPIANQHEETKSMVSKFQSILKIYNLVTIALLDARTLSYGCILSNENEWDCKFYCKQSYLLIYEFFVAYNKNNKSVNNIIQTDFPSLSEKRKLLAQKVKSFKSTHKIEEQGKDIRQKIAAHIELDFTLYNRYLNSLNREEVITTLTDFLSVLDEIQSFSGELIGLYSELLDEKMSSLQNGINVFKEEHKPELSQEDVAALDSMIRQLD